MARLIVPQHPDRVFKDASWSWDQTGYGYHSVGATGDATSVRWGLHEAFAVVLDEDAGCHERRLFDRILRLCEPFVAAEVFRLPGGPKCAVGFYMTDVKGGYGEY